MQTFLTRIRTRMSFWFWSLMAIGALVKIAFRKQDKRIRNRAFVE